jgi:immunoglobulin heavy chain
MWVHGEVVITSNCIECFSLSPGVLSQVQLHESRTNLLKPNQILPLTCAVSGYSITTNYCWAWIQQPTGKGLEWMGEIRYNGNTYYSSSLKSRTSISRDTSKKVLHAAELCDCRGHSCVLLCKKHSEGNSVWALTQTAMQGTLGLGCRKHCMFNQTCSQSNRRCRWYWSRTFFGLCGFLSSPRSHISPSDVAFLMIFCSLISSLWQ